MAYIYKITNKINQKVYIGKTEKTIKERFKQHKVDYKKEKVKNRPLYQAMNKYGIENFLIEEIEYVPLNIDSSEREKFWIQYYDSYNKGYNATLGGDGRPWLDYELIIKTYNEVKNISEVGRLLNIYPTTIGNILKQYNVPIEPGFKVSGRKSQKAVVQLDLKTLEVINIFPSIIGAERFLGLKNSSHINDVCKGKRKTSQGYKWQYLTDYILEKQTLVNCLF